MNGAFVTLVGVGSVLYLLISTYLPLYLSIYLSIYRAGHAQLQAKYSPSSPTWQGIQEQ